MSRSLRKISLTIQMSSVPQRERRDRPKVTRRLREASQNGHSATARAIWQAQSDERVARAISQEPFLCGNLQGKCRAHRPGPAFFASLRSRNAHGHVTRAILCRNLQGKRQTLIPRHPFCASPRSRNAHRHFTRAILCQGKCQTGRIPPRLNTGP